ncbi:hypothetical protein MHBO_001942 [Bonamia ostreae]|uniref:Uncharacterized protein n=1 Tax=Bonamia ostreae TaxID=126728 RepID=A0ABV2AKQ4_9EUKA
MNKSFLSTKDALKQDIKGDLTENLLNKISSLEISDIETAVRQRKLDELEIKKNLLSKIYGDHFFNTIDNELKFFSAASRLPGLKQSYFGLDILLNLDEDIDFDDINEKDIVETSKFDLKEELEKL